MCQGRIYNSIDIKWDYLLLRAIVHDLPLLGVEGRMKTLELEQVLDWHEALWRVQLPEPIIERIVTSQSFVCVLIENQPTGYPRSLKQKYHKTLALLRMHATDTENCTRCDVTVWGLNQPELDISESHIWMHAFICMCIWTLQSIIFNISTFNHHKISDCLNYYATTHYKVMVWQQVAA